MTNMPFLAIHSQAPRHHLGYLEEFWQHTGNRCWQYVGWRKAETIQQGIGAEWFVEFSTLEPMEIQKGISKVVKIKPRTWLRRMVVPLQGRTIQ